MKNVFLLNLRILFVCTFMFSTLFVSAQRDTIKIDIGPAGEQWESPAPWNNLTGQMLLIDSCTNTQGQKTGTSIEVTDPFFGANTLGGAADDSLGIDPKASQDWFWLENADKEGVITFSNLDTGKLYNFGFYGHRSADGIRDIKIIVEGTDKDSIIQNACRNTSTISRINNVHPKNDSTIIVTCIQGADPTSPYAYLGAIILSYPWYRTDVGPVQEGISSSIGVYPNPASNYINVQIEAESNMVYLEIFDLNGRKVLDLQKQVSIGNNVINVSTNKLDQGTYILKVHENKKTAYSKFVICNK